MLRSNGEAACSLSRPFTTADVATVDSRNGKTQKCWRVWLPTSSQAQYLTGKRVQQNSLTQRPRGAPSQKGATLLQSRQQLYFRMC